MIAIETMKWSSNLNQETFFPETCVSGFHVIQKHNKIDNHFHY
jgi:hypothetical protein